MCVCVMHNSMQTRPHEKERSNISFQFCMLMFIIVFIPLLRLTILNFIIIFIIIILISIGISIDIAIILIILIAVNQVICLVCVYIYMCRECGKLIRYQVYASISLCLAYVNELQLESLPQAHHWQYIQLHHPRTILSAH